MKTTIRRINPGTLFEYGGVRWVKLDALEEGGALVLASDVLFNRAFDTENRNDWTCSTLREELGGAFADSLQEAGGNFNDFSLFRQYLTANDGMKRYGSTIDGIALLSCEQYRKYRDIIPQATERWWTITPYSCEEDYAAFVCAVKRDGSVDYDAACCNDWGVRPACVMEPDTLIETVTLTQKTTPLRCDSKAEEETEPGIEKRIAEAFRSAANGEKVDFQITVHVERAPMATRTAYK